MLADPEFAAELDDLKKDAPPGQGPFLSDMSHLRRDPKPSERQEAGVAALATNPVPREVPDVPGTKVVLNAPPVENPEAQQARRLQVTQPDIKKKEQLGLPTDLDFEGRSLAGTLKFKKPPLNPTAEVAPSVEVAPTNELTTELAPSAEPGPPPIVAPIAPPIEEEPSVPRHRHPWIWIGVILLALGAVAALALVLARDDSAVTSPTGRNLDPAATAAVTTPQTGAVAVATATARTTIGGPEETVSATPAPIGTIGSSTATVDTGPLTTSSAHPRPSTAPSAPATTVEPTVAPPTASTSSASTSSHPATPAASSSGRGLIFDFQKRNKVNP